MTSNIIDIEEEIAKSLLSVNSERLSTAIQYGVLINQGLIDLIAPSIEIITGISIDYWIKKSIVNITKWHYTFDWLVPNNYSICVDHRKRVKEVNSVLNYIHHSSHHKFIWGLCQWYYELTDSKKKGIVVTSNKDFHLEKEVEWLRKGVNNNIKIVEVPNIYSYETMYKNYQLAIYENLDLMDKTKIKSNIMYYLSHKYLIDTFSNNKSLNINNINKY